MKTKRASVDIEYDEHIFDEKELFAKGKKLYSDIHINISISDESKYVEIIRQEANILIYALDKLTETEKAWKSDPDFLELYSKISKKSGGCT